MALSIFPNRLASLWLVCFALVMASGRASAATIVVDGVQCTLAEAIVAANTNAAVGGCRAGNDRSVGGDIIDLRADVILATWDHLDDNGCPNGLPAVTSRILINGAGHTIARDSTPTPAFRVLDSSTGALTLNRVTVKNGQSENCDGGGIKGRTLTLVDSTVSHNIVFGGKGGGISAGSVTLIRSTVSDNLGGGLHVDGYAFLSKAVVVRNNGYADNSAGGLEIHGVAVLAESTVSDNAAGGRLAIGGGLYVDGTALLTSSTVSNNVADGDVGVGGGLFLYRGSATFINSTVSGNIAQGGSAGATYAGSGGGIYSSGIDPLRTGPGGSVTLVYTTVSGNGAIGPSSPPGFTGGTGGGILSDILRLTNSIVANNSATNASALDCSSTDVQFRGVNLIGDGSCGAAASGQLLGDPMLSPLGDFGGNTFTQPPLPRSPAIDAIAVNRYGTCSPAWITVDQRGIRRPSSPDHACDIGAVEYVSRTR